MIELVKARLRGFLAWHTVHPILNQSRELFFQHIVSRDLARLGVVDDFYPLGGAASYALLYLLIRILRENDVRTIIELGSGESTRLIDRIKRDGTTHVCYEHDPEWQTRTRSRLSTCDYRLRPLGPFRLGGADYDWYTDVELMDFDLLLVDGPIGTPRLSRIGCWQIVDANRKKDFVMIIDDSTRPGEQETVGFILDRLKAKGLAPILHRVESGNVPALICCGRFGHLRYYG